jgi:hypothetical protein
MQKDNIKIGVKMWPRLTLAEVTTQWRPLMYTAMDLKRDMLRDSSPGG